MKLSRLGLVLFTSFLLVSASGCGIINRIRAKNEINEAARAYKAGKFQEAEEHSRRALELDPDQKNAPIFIARTVHAQYRSGNDSPDNVAIANKAIEAYKFVLQREPANEESYLAVTALLGAIKKEAEQRQWIKSHATSPAVSGEKRADAYTLLASMDWNCVYQITEIAKQTQGTKIVWVKPKEQEDLDTAKQCATSGMENAEKAIGLNAESDLAWSYKMNLLREQAKIAEMEGNAENKDKLLKEADSLQKKVTELTERNQKRKDAEEAAKKEQENAK
jgi:tetratricopeptide (TPR) repeat protein